MLSTVGWERFEGLGVRGGEGFALTVDCLNRVPLVVDFSVNSTLFTVGRILCTTLPGIVSVTREMQGVSAFPSSSKQTQYSHTCSFRSHQKDTLYLP